MSLRKEVFQDKVLQRLYPPVPKAGTVQDTTDPRSAPASEVKPKPNKSPGCAEASGFVGKKVYTVLPPPEDYKPTIREEKPEIISTAGGTAVDPLGSEDSEVTEGEDHARKRRKRRRKRKAETERICASPQDQGECLEAGRENGQTVDIPVGQERLSKSKKRKLKKKRQKEKLRSLGLAPQSRALEFTYIKDRDEEKEEMDEESSQKVEEVVDFLRSTWNIYVSDRSSPAENPSLSLSTVESLFTRLSGGTAPPSAVSSLCHLTALLKDEEQLNKALQEFDRASALTTDETRMVCTLFCYWLSDILPLQTEQQT